jgi:hypothetical protein
VGLFSTHCSRRASAAQTPSQIQKLPVDFVPFRRGDKRRRYSGVVVQLVRIPACHAGGRGFEPRPLRQNEKRRTVWFVFFFAFIRCRRLPSNPCHSERSEESLSHAQSRALGMTMEVRPPFSAVPLRPAPVPSPQSTSPARRSSTQSRNQSVHPRSASPYRCFPSTRPRARRA